MSARPTTLRQAAISNICRVNQIGQTIIVPPADHTDWRTYTPSVPISASGDWHV